MEVHTQFGDIKTLKDVAVRLFLIVAGVVIAFTFTQWREQKQRQELSSQMKARLVQEVAENAKALERTTAAYEASKTTLQAGAELCRKVVETKTLDTVAAKKFDEMQIDLRTPPLSSTQWTLAVANQSLRDFTVDDAATFASMYALQKGIEDVFMQHKAPVTAAFVDSGALRAGANVEEITRGCRAISYLQLYSQTSAANLQGLLKRYSRYTSSLSAMP